MFNKFDKEIGVELVPNKFLRSWLLRLICDLVEISLYSILFLLI